MTKFIKELKTTFSNKSKIADTKQEIKTFKQGKKHITNFMIEFEVLVIKIKIDDLYTVFLLNITNKILTGCDT